MYNCCCGSGNPTNALPSQGTTNNGNVMGYWYQDSANSALGHTATYTYDGVNRLGTAAATGNSTYNLTFSYDAYGNMACSTNGQTNGPCPNWSFNSSNHISTSGFTYDAAGNVTGDGLHTYQWDAEGRRKSIDSGSTANITFNALGWRAYRSTSSASVSYWEDPAGHYIGGYWGGWNAAIPLGGRMLAEYSGYTTGPMNFDHPNALGSEQQWTNAAGGGAGEVQFYPWGQVWGNTTNGNLYQLFASLLWYDPETDGYQAAFRYYIPRHGRWLTPDPLGGSIASPQSLNRYAYVTNNPTSLTDPLGLRIPYAYAEGFDCTTGVLPCAGSLGLDYLETGEGFTGGEWSPGYFNGDVGTQEGSSGEFGGGDTGQGTAPNNGQQKQTM